MRGLICHYELRLVPESRPCLSEPDSMIRAGRDRGWCFHRRSHLLGAGDGVKVKSQGASPPSQLIWLPFLPQWDDAQQKQGVCGLGRLQPDQRLPVWVPLRWHRHHCVLQRGGGTFKVDGGCRSCQLWDHIVLTSRLKGGALTPLPNSRESRERCCLDFQVLFFLPPGSSRIWFSFQKKDLRLQGASPPGISQEDGPWPKNVLTVLSFPFILNCV